MCMITVCIIRHKTTTINPYAVVELIYSSWPSLSLATFYCYSPIYYFTIVVEDQKWEISWDYQVT